MARAVAARKRARRRLAAKRKIGAVARPQATNSVGPKVTPLKQILNIVAAIDEVFFLFLSIVAAIVKTSFRLLSALLAFLQVIFGIMEIFKW
jgi:hypothetical protein